MSVKIEKSWYFFGALQVCYDCPSCGSSLKSPPEEIDTLDTCPNCDSGFTVPGAIEYQKYLESKKTKSKKEIENEKLSDAVIAAVKEEIARANEPKPPFSYQIIDKLPLNFDFDRELTIRIAYYNKFRFYSPLLIDNPKVKLGVPANLCPYCNETSNKGSCLSCGKEYLTVTSLKDYKVKMNIQYEWNQTVDEQRAILEGCHQAYLKQYRLRQAIKDILIATGENSGLKKRIEYIANERERRIYAKNWEWDSYRSATFEMAKSLIDDFDALIVYMEVCYLDLNGASNSNPSHDREMLKLNPPWDKKFRDCPLACRVYDLSNGMKKEELKALFIKVATEIQQKLGCPVRPETAFNKLWKAIREDQGY